MTTLKHSANPPESLSAADVLQQELRLSCGQVLKNRIVKSAMSEILGTRDHGASDGLAVLYRRWAEGGTGLLITGNVMIDARALGEPGNVVLEDDRHLESMAAWAKAGQQQGCQIWMQLNHPGKQSPKFLSAETVAPSSVGFGPQLAAAFPVPRALTEADIHNLIARFGRSAALAKQAGFNGVQIHGAHGYLVSQFLSPHHNVRTDNWGGSLENRSRFVLEVLRAMREGVGADFPIGIKINSADFQKGGFSEDDSLKVMTELEKAGIDMIEVSGGTYEAPVMTGWKRESTRVREGYFLDFVERASKVLSVPLCITGGFRSPEGMARAVREDSENQSRAAELVGLARTLAIQPDFPKQIFAGEDPQSLVGRLSTGLKTLDRLAMLDVTWYENQLARMASGKDPKPHLSSWLSVAQSVTRMGWQAFRMRRAKA